MSPSEWLADVEVAERRPAGDRSLSAAEFERLARSAAPLLYRVGASAESGSTMRLGRRRGPTWISVASPRGHGRIIRHPDGSFVSSAHRSADGGLVLDARGDAVRAADFDDLVAAVSETVPSWPAGRQADRTGRPS
jgi:hypothetical protein